MVQANNMFGRAVIYTSAGAITAANVVEVLTKATSKHLMNRGEIDYLYRYYKGQQPILGREKDIRPEICNKIVENRANEIVTFKTSYFVGEPVQYVSCANSKDELNDDIEVLNRWMNGEDKDAKDQEVADWMHICGTAYRMVSPNHDGDCPEEAPFHIYTLDPRDTFIVYYSGLGNKPMMAVNVVPTEDDRVLYAVYTETEYFEIVDGVIRTHTSNLMGMIPIVEYPANKSRLGAFEIVLPLLDAINETASNRADGVEQFIQALLVLKGVDIDSEDFAKLKQMGGIKVPVEGDVNYLIQELDQSSTQTLIDDQYETVLTICGMPSRTGGNSSGDRMGAVVYRDGFFAAEARARNTEKMFKASERKFLRVALSICDTIEGGEVDLKMSDIDIRFTRRNYEDIMSKSQVLTTMLSTGKIHPKLAFESCGMFADPERAYNLSAEYAEEQEQKLLDQMSMQAGDEDTADDNTEGTESSAAD